MVAIWVLLLSAAFAYGKISVNAQSPKDILNPVIDPTESTDDLIVEVAITTLTNIIDLNGGNHCSHRCKRYAICEAAEDLRHGNGNFEKFIAVLRDDARLKELRNSEAVAGKSFRMEYKCDSSAGEPCNCKFSHCITTNQARQHNNVRRKPTYELDGEETRFNYLSSDGKFEYTCQPPPEVNEDDLETFFECQEESSQQRRFASRRIRATPLEVAVQTVESLRQRKSESGNQLRCDHNAVCFGAAILQENGGDLSDFLAILRGKQWASSPDFEIIARNSFNQKYYYSDTASKPCDLMFSCIDTSKDTVTPLIFPGNGDTSGYLDTLVWSTYNTIMYRTGESNSPPDCKLNAVYKAVVELLKENGANEHLMRFITKLQDDFRIQSLPFADVAEKSYQSVYKCQIGNPCDCHFYCPGSNTARPMSPTSEAPRYHLRSNIRSNFL